MKRAILAGAAALVLAGGAALLFMAAPQLTVLNDGFRVDYGWAAPLGAALAALGAIGFALTLRSAPARAACGLLTVAAVVAGVQRAAWQVGADRGALSARSLTDHSRIAWPEVRQVQSDPDALQVIGFGDARIRIGIRGMRAHDRATLERTVARRVQETSPAAAR